MADPRPARHPQAAGHPQGEFNLLVIKILNSLFGRPTSDWPSGLSGVGHPQDVESGGMADPLHSGFFSQGTNFSPEFVLISFDETSSVVE